MTRVWALLTVIAGLAVVGSALVSASIDEVAALGDCAVDGSIIRYELARTADDLTYVFGAVGDTCRSLRVEAMDALNRVDLFTFAPAYTAFLVFSAFFLAGGEKRLLVAPTAALAVLAGALDGFETLGLLHASPDHAPSEAQMTQIWLFATGKFVALVLNALLLAGLALSRKSVGRWIVAGLLCLPAFGVAAMYADLEFIPAQTLAFSTAWLGVLALAIGAVGGRVMGGTR